MAEVNQQMIADKLGLSKATVSRCFTNHAGISPTTRAKVFQLAAEIGYKHLENRSTSAKKKKPKPSFTVLICSDTEEYFQGEYSSPGEEILAGVSEFAQTNKISIDIDFVSPSITTMADPAFKKIKSLRSRKNRGILLIYPFADSLVRELAPKFPLVSLVDQLQHQSLDCVDVDHNSGISNVIDHLVEEGHERIGFYTRDYTVQASWSFRRYGAFIEKMARLKMKVLPEDVLGIHPHTFPSVSESITSAVERTKDGVTAWVCAADHQAYDLVSGLENQGISVPRDVSITGYDGIEQTPERLPLTTVEIPFRSIGMTGAERLASRIKKRFGGRQSVYIAGNLRKGKSVGPAKG